MTPIQLKRYLATLIQQDLKTSTMIWGPPGIGKSSIVQQLAQENGCSCIDLRLSQLAPTDLRGLPVADEG
ncbi:MAG: AAA family ATPase, partial [Leptolyngbya sp. SIO1D8]|nr:AAA family ATPase [Leptolyngbya sp. SIO1D8]